MDVAFFDAPNQRRHYAVQQNPLIAELLEGLTSRQKKINPKFFYDEKGSELFDQITTLPGYYPSRTEINILKQNAAAIASLVGKGSVLIEPGAGSCEKIRYLLDDLRPAAYLPQDISGDFLRRTTTDLKALYPWLKVHPLIGDFASSIELPSDLPEGRRVAFYPGSTIGNFEPCDAVDFLHNMRELVGDDGGLIVGVDLQKDSVILNAAYNDEAGVTAAFNRNVLNHVNQILGCEIDCEAFSHHAFYNEEKQRIEMHLVSNKHQRVNCNGVILEIAQAESIHTESSYKYTPASFARLASKAGFSLQRAWIDDNGLFGVHYLT